MTDQTRSHCDLMINNARVFDGEKMRDGLLSVGIAGNKISFVQKAPARAVEEIDAAGKMPDARPNRLPPPFAGYVDRDG